MHHGLLGAGCGGLGPNNSFKPNLIQALAPNQTMSTSDLRAPWAITLRHLAASQFYLPASFAAEGPNAAWAPVKDYLHHNEFGLALDEAIELGAECSAPREYWTELLLAAENMSLTEQLARIRVRL